MKHYKISKSKAITSCGMENPNNLPNGPLQPIQNDLFAGKNLSLQTGQDHRHWEERQSTPRCSTGLHSSLYWVVHKRNSATRQGRVSCQMILIAQLEASRESFYFLNKKSREVPALRYKTLSLCLERWKAGRKNQKEKWQKNKANLPCLDKRRKKMAGKCHHHDSVSS